MNLCKTRSLQFSQSHDETRKNKSTCKWWGLSIRMHFHINGKQSHPAHVVTSHQLFAVRFGFFPTQVPLWVFATSSFGVALKLEGSRLIDARRAAQSTHTHTHTHTFITHTLRNLSWSFHLFYKNTLGIPYTQHECWHLIFPLEISSPPRRVTRPVRTMNSIFKMGLDVGNERGARDTSWSGTT